LKGWIVVAFCSIDSPYEFELSQHLLPSLEKLGIPHHIDVTENKGSWIRNVAEKPAVIYRALEKYPHKDLVVLDADSEILEYPKLFDEIPEEYDLALHTLDWNSWYRNGSNVKEVLSGTMFIRNTPQMKDLAAKWYNLASDYSTWEQKCLDKVIKEMNIKVFPLPIEYCWIQSLPDGSGPFIKCDNKVVVHFQSSRKYKRLIK
jgi:hypothetical protein